MDSKLVELREKFAVKHKELFDYWQEAGDQRDVTKIDSIKSLASHDTTGRVEFLKSLNKEVDALAAEIEPLADIEQMKSASDEREKALKTPTSRLPQPSSTPADGNQQGEEKTMGRLFVESPEYKAFMGIQQRSPTMVEMLKGYYDLDLKTIFRTASGWAPEEVRLSRVELDPQRPIAVIDRITQSPTGADTIRYMEETTFTNNAVETAEATATADANLVGEAALILTERTRAVEWLPVFIPVTMQQLEDVVGIEEYINDRLTFMIRQRLDSQILVGNGATPNLLGTNNVIGINTQAKGVDPVTDAIYKGMDLVRTVGFTEPTQIFMHPTDWQAIRLQRTADGIYILGSPTEAGPERLWGVPVLQTTAQTQNTAVLGDYRTFATLHQKRGITLAASDSHAYNFTRGTISIRADMRVAMVHYRPEAFCTVTGI